MPDGRWFTKWGGKRHYFGRDDQLAVARYTASLQAWARWRDRRTQARTAINADLDGTCEPLVIDLIEKFLASRILRSSKHRYENYRTCLRRFSHVYGYERVADIGIAHLDSLRDDLLAGGFKITTINAEMSVIKTCLNWGYAYLSIPAKPLVVFKRLPEGEPPNRAMTKAQVRQFLMDVPAHVRAWLAVCYLTAARPVEVIRMVSKQGKWLYSGVFRLDKGKTDLSRSPRHMIVSPLAQRWLARCKKHWSSTHAFRDAVTYACPEAPETVRLRHSAMTHLLQAGIPRADADLILGHVPARVSRTYGQEKWTRLVPLAAQLSFRREPATREDQKRKVKIS